MKGMMNRKAILLSALCLIALCVTRTSSGCQGAKVVRRPPPSFEGLEDCLDPAPPLRTPQEKQRCVYLLERFLKAEPDHPRADETSFRLGQLYLETGDFSAAYHLFRSFPRGAPEGPKTGGSEAVFGRVPVFSRQSDGFTRCSARTGGRPEGRPWAEGDLPVHRRELREAREPPVGPDLVCSMLRIDGRRCRQGATPGPDPGSHVSSGGNPRPRRPRRSSSQRVSSPRRSTWAWWRPVFRRASFDSLRIIS